MHVNTGQPGNLASDIFELAAKDSSDDGCRRIGISPQCDGVLHGGRQAVGFSQDMQNARHRGQGVERRLRRVRWPVPTGGSPEGLEGGGMECVPLR